MPMLRVTAHETYIKQKTKNKKQAEIKLCSRFESKTNYCEKGTRPLPPKGERNFLIRDEYYVKLYWYVGNHLAYAIHGPRYKHIHHHTNQAEGSFDHRLASLSSVAQPRLPFGWAGRARALGFRMSDSEAKKKTTKMSRNVSNVWLLILISKRSLHFRTGWYIRRGGGSKARQVLFLNREKKASGKPARDCGNTRKPASRHEAKDSSAMDLAPLCMEAVRLASVA